MYTRHSPVNYFVNNTSNFSAMATLEYNEFIAELASMMGGFAAVLLQVANPKIAAAIAAHSSFTNKPFQRGRRTLIYIYCTTLGTQDERHYITRMTYEAHARVKSRNFDVDNESLQLWVAATIYWTMINSYETVYGKLNKPDAEEIYTKFSALATELRVPRESWPQYQDFENYWEETISTLEITQEARDIAKYVLRPRGLFRKASPIWILMLFFGHIVRIITTEMLPEVVRIAYDIPSTTYTRTMFTAIIQAIRTVYPRLPRSLRQIVKTYYMHDMRKRRAKGKCW